MIQIHYKQNSETDLKKGKNNCEKKLYIINIIIYSEIIYNFYQCYHDNFFLLCWNRIKCNYLIKIA